MGTGAVGIAKMVGHGTADVAGGIAHGTADVVGGIGKGAFTGGKIIAGGGVDLVTGVGDFSKEQFDMINQEVRSIHKFTPKKYSFIKS